MKGFIVTFTVRSNKARISDLFRHAIIIAKNETRMKKLLKERFKTSKILTKQRITVDREYFKSLS